MPRTNRIITTAAAITAIAATGVASAATAPFVSHQSDLHGHAPLTIPGTGVKQGDWMGSKAQLVYKTVRVSKGQKPTVTLTAPAGQKIRGLARDGEVGFVVKAKGGYAGQRSVTFTVYAAGRQADSSRGHVYALTK